MICKHCKNISFYEQVKGPHIGLYCTVCGRWFKWKSRNEKVISKTDVTESITMTEETYDLNDELPWE